MLGDIRHKVRCVVGRPRQPRPRQSAQQPARGRSASLRFPNGRQRPGCAGSRRRPAIVSSATSGTSVPDATSPRSLRFSSREPDNDNFSPLQ
jgi:hypothetical protein